MKLKAATLIAVATAFILVARESAAKADPGHGIIRYYTEQKEKSAMEDCQRLKENCRRNSRGSDPRCTGPAISACFDSSSAAAPPAAASAIVTAVVMILAML